MNKILIIDQTEGCTKVIANSLVESGYMVMTAENVFRAAAILHKKKFDLILCSQTLFFESQSPLKEIILEDTRHSKVILLQERWEETVASFDNPRIIGQILKPVDQEKLLEIISTQIQTSGFTGMVNDIDITDYLQLLAMNKATKAFVVEGESGNGVMVLHKGELVYVKYNEFRGDLAFHALMALENGRIVDKQLKRIPARNVTSSLSRLLLEASKNRDESKAEERASTDDFLIGESYSSLIQETSHPEVVSESQAGRGRGAMLLGVSLLLLVALGGLVWSLLPSEDSVEKNIANTIEGNESVVTVYSDISAGNPELLPEFELSSHAGGTVAEKEASEKPVPEQGENSAVAAGGEKTEIDIPRPAVVEPDIILRLHGSNTIGATLAVNLASDYLAHRFGGTDIKVRAGKESVEKIITADTATGLVGIEIYAHGSSTGFKDLASGTCDVAMASRKIKEKEVVTLAKFGDMTDPAAEHILGLDGIAVIVNKGNPVKTLTIEQIAAIFSGKIKDWKDLTDGRHEGPIHIYARDEKSGTFDTFKGIVLKKLVIDESAKRYESNADLSDDVARDRLGIGFTGLPYIRQSKAISVSDLGTIPIYPNFFTVATEDYLLARRLYLYIPPNSENQTATDFIDYSLTAPGQLVVNDTGFVDLGIRSFAASIDTDGLIIQNRVVFEHYTKETKDKKRLSLNFRFRANSTVLDNRALRDLDRMVEFLKNQPIDGVTLIGFADSKGEYHYNTNLALERSKVVRRELKSRGIPITSVISASEEMPVSSNMTTRGREKNRRVEVWVRLNKV